jgi:hypothetical protein
LLTLTIILAGALVYGLGILILGGIEQREIEMIPGIGPQLADWLRYFKLVRG